jgi:hypothetical protein
MHSQTVDYSAVLMPSSPRTAPTKRATTGRHNRRDIVLLPITILVTISGLLSLSNFCSPLLQASSEPDHHRHNTDGKEGGQEAQPERTRDQHSGSLRRGFGLLPGARSHRRG